MLAALAFPSTPVFCLTKSQLQGTSWYRMIPVCHVAVVVEPIWLYDLCIVSPAHNSLAWTSTIQVVHASIQLSTFSGKWETIETIHKNLKVCFFRGSFLLVEVLVVVLACHSHTERKLDGLVLLHRLRFPRSRLCPAHRDGTLTTSLQPPGQLLSVHWHLPPLRVRLPQATFWQVGFNSECPK